MKSAKKDEACELGSGSGIISLLSMTKGKFKHIDMFELQKDLYDISLMNLEENGLNDSISSYNINIKNIPTSFNNKYSCVFSNPPYIRTNQGFENKDYSDRICCTELEGSALDFVLCASRLLKNGGSFYCVYRPARLAYLLSCMKSCKLEPKRMTLVYPLVDSKPCLVLVEGKKQGNEDMFITKPLIIYKSKKDKQSDENYTDDMKYIYKEGNFSDEFKLP